MTHRLDPRGYRPRLPLRAIAAALAIQPICFGTSATAATWLVRPDGTGDAPTIQAAVNAAAVGDTILLAPGTFRGPDNRNVVFRGLLLRSEAGPEVTILDCEGSSQSPARAFHFGSQVATATIVEGVTVRNGFSDNRFGENPGAAILVEGAGVEPTVRNCVFENNSSVRAVVAMRSEAGGRFEGCRFEDNTGGHLSLEVGLGGSGFEPNLLVTDCTFTGGGFGASLLGPSGGVRFTRCRFERLAAPSGAALAFGALRDAVFEACVFVENDASDRGAAVSAQLSTARFEDCLFARNTAGTGSAAWFQALDVTFTRCTFVDNETIVPRGGAPAGVVAAEGADLVLEDTILAFNTGSPAVTGDAASTATASCTDVFGNPGGNWTGLLTGQDAMGGNLETDPLFCDRSGGDYTLASASPCLPENNACGATIGAFDEGCKATPVIGSTWGRIKNAFR